MSYREKEIVTLFDRNFSISYLVQLYENGNIRFPQTLKEKMTEKNIVTHLIEAIRQGIPMPVVYASELQNGDILILESENILLYLLEFVRGSFSVFIDGISKKSKFYFFELDNINPWLSAMIMRTVFMFRIIDYRTPKYLHMEVGLFHERWKVSKEQAVRDSLYSGKKVESLRRISMEVMFIINGSKKSGEDYRNEYIVLYMMLFWGVYKNGLWTDEDMTEQELLDAVISTLDESRYIWQDFLDVIKTYVVSYFWPISILEQINPFHKKLKDKDIRYRTKMLGLFICLCDMFQGSMIMDIFNNKK